MTVVILLLVVEVEVVTVAVLLGDVAFAIIACGVRGNSFVNLATVLLLPLFGPPKTEKFNG